MGLSLLENPSDLLRCVRFESGNASRTKIRTVGSLQFLKGTRILTMKPEAGSMESYRTPSMSPLFIGLALIGANPMNQELILL